MSHLNTSFKPAWWLNNGHLQTLFPTLFRRRAKLQTQRERFELNDGDFVDVDWFNNQNNTNAPLVILLHGLAGSSKSNYVLGMTQAIAKMGWRVAALNFRGCSGEQNRLARAYHSGDTGDIEAVFQQIKQREPNSDIYCIGFSLGGNVLLKWLGEQQQKSSVKAAIAISVPMVLSECANKLDLGFSKVYRAYLMQPLKRFILNKHIHLKQLNNNHEAAKIEQLGDLKQVKSFWQYDHQVVAKLHGYASAADYYQKSSSRQFIPNIAVPTLIIHAIDDPFMTVDVIPQTDEIPNHVELEIANGGGHVGFISGSNPLKPQYWAEQRVEQFLSTQEKQ